MPGSGLVTVCLIFTYIELIVQIPLFVNVDGVKWKLSNITFYIVLDLLPNVNNCMLSLPARLLHPMWMNLSENRKIEILLHGSENLGHEDNVKLMQIVQLFIVNTKRFQAE